MCGSRARGARTSVYRGVSYNRKNRKWQAAINVYGGYLYLGLYVDEARAAEMYDMACLKVRGLHCKKVNFAAHHYLDAAGQLRPDAHVDRLIQKAKQHATERLLREAFDGGDNDDAADEGGNEQQPWRAGNNAASDVDMLAAAVNNAADNAADNADTAAAADNAGTAAAADGSAGHNSGSHNSNRRSEGSAQQARQLGVKMAVLKQRLGRRRTAGLEQELLAALQAADDDAAESQSTAAAAAPMAPAVTTGAKLVATNSIGGALAATNDSSSQLLFGGADAGLGVGGSTHALLQQLPSSFSAWQPPAAWLQEPMALPLLQPAIQDPEALQELPAPSLAPQQPALVPGTGGEQLALPSIHLPSIQELLRCEAEGAGLQQLQAQWMTEVASLDAGALLTNVDWSALSAAAPGMAAAPSPQMAARAAGTSGSSRHETSSNGSSAGALPGLLAANGLTSVDITWLAAQVPESCQLRHVINHTGGLFGILYATRAADGSEQWGTAVWDGCSFTHSDFLPSAQEAAQVCSQVLQLASAAAW